MPSESATHAQRVSKECCVRPSDWARASSTESENCSDLLLRGVIRPTSTATKRSTPAQCSASPTFTMSLRNWDSALLPAMVRRRQRMSARSAAERPSTAEAAPAQAERCFDDAEKVRIAGKRLNDSRCGYGHSPVVQISLTSSVVQISLTSYRAT